jgi:hypothetical protein
VQNSLEQKNKYSREAKIQILVNYALFKNSPRKWADIRDSSSIFKGKTAEQIRNKWRLMNKSPISIKNNDLLEAANKVIFS